MTPSRESPAGGYVRDRAQLPSMETHLASPRPAPQPACPPRSAPLRHPLTSAARPSPRGDPPLWRNLEARLKTTALSREGRFSCVCPRERLSPLNRLFVLSLARSRYPGFGSLLLKSQEREVSQAAACCSSPSSLGGRGGTQGYRG